MLHAALQTATAAGYLSIFMDTANDLDHQSRALATLRDRQVDALLVISPDLINFGAVELMSTIPTILVNCLDPNAGLTSIVADEPSAGSGGARPHESGAFCTHERLAVGAVLAAAKLGVRIPLNLSVVTLEDGRAVGVRSGSPAHHNRAAGSSYGRAGRDHDLGTLRWGH
jgi:DNA-binding LacI/PurR family transcriptional regulator